MQALRHKDGSNEQGLSPMQALGLLKKIRFAAFCIHLHAVEIIISRLFLSIKRGRFDFLINGCW
jgi:hypothetical protein